MGKNKNKSDLTAVIIGFSSIFLISALFFLKFHFFDQKKEASLADSAAESAAKSATNFPSITDADLVKKINQKGKMMILDSRDTDSFNAEHILDSKNFAFDNLAENIADFDKNETYVFVDNFGLTPTEIQAMQIFKSNDINDIAYLEGGLTAWKNDYEPTISIGNPYSLADHSKTTYIDSPTLNTKISHKELLYIVDVRSNAEYTQGHIPGAVNIYLDDLERRRHELPVAKKIALYDNNGVGAFQGAVRLFDAGILNVYTLSDGFDTWKQKKFAVTAN